MNLVWNRFYRFVIIVAGNKIDSFVDAIEKDFKKDDLKIHSGSKINPWLFVVAVLAVLVYLLVSPCSKYSSEICVD